MNAVYLLQDEDSPEVYNIKNSFQIRQLAKLLDFASKEQTCIILNIKGVEDFAYEKILQFLFMRYLIKDLKFTLALVGALNESIFFKKHPKYYKFLELNIVYIPNDPYSEFSIDCQNYINIEKFGNFLMQNSFELSQPLGSKHQLANEWGAYKLAHTSGLIYLLERIERINSEFKKPYFSFLKCKHQIHPTNEPFKELNLANNRPSFLLIDDNHDKGWSLVFEHILAHEDVGGFRLKVHEDFQGFEDIVQEQRITNSIISQIKSENICGVLLDLRLKGDKEEQPEFDHTDIQSFSGGRMLEAIKREYPCLPVIIVTASNKVWNAEQLRQAGADGFFVKEDPTIFISPEVSKSNYQAFENLIKECYEKHKKLYLFWKYIKKIEIDNYIEEKIISIGPVSTSPKVQPKKSRVPYAQFQSPQGLKSRWNCAV